MAKTKKTAKAKPKKTKRAAVKTKPKPKTKTKPKPKPRPKPVKKAAKAKSIAKPRQNPKAVPAPVASAPRLRSPIPVAWLFDEEGRERALDSLASWTVSTLQAAQADEAAARETLKIAVETFYDIREAAQQPRGEYAGQFFIVDGVGLGDSNRPVPWQVLSETVPQEHLTRLSAIFEEIEREAT